jgi:F-type H+-transporting ATPase subunit epsilon
MRLRIVTPLSVVAEEENVVALRAEDASGSFGILRGHADFLTSLSLSVLGWQREDTSQNYCAVRRGLLTVSGGREITVVTREAVLGDDLDTLDQKVLAKFRAAAESQKTEHVEQMRLQLNAIRRIMHYLRPDRLGGS